MLTSKRTAQFRFNTTGNAAFTARRMAYGRQRGRAGSRMYLQTIIRRGTKSDRHRHHQPFFPTWLNERCKRGTTERPRLSQNLWEYWRLCSPSTVLCSPSVGPGPSVGSHICSSETHAGLKLLQSYLLIVSDLDHAACECIFVCRLSLFETC